MTTNGETKCECPRFSARSSDENTCVCGHESDEHSLLRSVCCATRIPLPPVVERGERMTDAETWPPRIDDKALNWNLDALKGILRGSVAAVVPLVVVEQELKRSRSCELGEYGMRIAAQERADRELSTLRADNARLTAERDAAKESAAYWRQTGALQADDRNEWKARALAAEQERDVQKNAAWEWVGKHNEQQTRAEKAEQERDAVKKTLDAANEIIRIDADLQAKTTERAESAEARLQSVTAALEKVTALAVQHVRREVGRDAALIFEYELRALSAPSPKPKGGFSALLGQMPDLKSEEELEAEKDGGQKP